MRIRPISEFSSKSEDPVMCQNCKVKQAESATYLGKVVCFDCLPNERKRQMEILRARQFQAAEHSETSSYYVAIDIKHQTDETEGPDCDNELGDTYA